MMKQHITRIQYNKPVALDTFELALYCPDMDYAGFTPGQFAHLRIPNAPDLLLRRPFSINHIDKQESTVTIVYQTVGRGTELLSKVETGAEIDAILPIGNGFPMKYKNILLIGGGMGAAPLRAAAESAGASCDALLGFRNKDYAYQTEVFKASCENLWLATDDGSLGQKGFVTDILETLDLSFYDAFFCCGPVPMFKALQKFFSVKSLPVYVSLEERMGCGMGGCAVCVCKIESQTDYHYKKVCLDGPVFALKEVSFE